MRFTKMQGLGNDYIYVNCFEETVDNPERLAPIISDRHFGIGSDGLVLICPSTALRAGPSTVRLCSPQAALRAGPSKAADVRMRIFNADGSEAEMSGNGIRCVAKYAYEHKLAKAGGAFSIPGQPAWPASVRIETGNGVLTVGLAVDKADKVEKVCVNMGQPILTPKDIPVELSGKEVIEEPIEILGEKLRMSCVSMGNPHAVFFCDNVEAVELEKIGPVIENHSIFPNRVNVHFAEVLGEGEFKMQTWERGSGITMACGSGACACCVAANLTKRCGRDCIAHLAGGDLQLNWCEQDNCVYMTGPAVEVFEGIWPGD